MVIGVTGSVGKTSTREAIRAVIATTRRTRAAEKNYNNEIGLPATVLGVRPPGRSVFRWTWAMLCGSALALVRRASYPEVLVLEYGADHPGDIDVLTAIAPPSIAVVTAVGPAHTAFFGSVDRVIAEKRRLVTALSPDGVAVLNGDDANVEGMRERTHARVVTYGFREGVDVRGVEYQPTMERDAPSGIAFKMMIGGSAVPVHLPGCLGRGHAAAALAAAAVGCATGMHLVEISHALEGYTPPPGRMRIIGGVRRTTLLDDSYNASPLAVAVALTALAGLPVAGRRFAVLGDMLELGTLTEHEHVHMGELAANTGLAYLIAVGEASRHLAVAARSLGMPADRVIEFATAADAGRHVQDLLQPGDVVLVKGSQGMRMERVVRELMAEPLRARELLCRQDDEWLT
jgi:UDP-N-acetylmuramoyl-tripeptide--D-alanyl-D-alanine ligase